MTNVPHTGYNAAFVFAINDRYIGYRHGKGGLGDEHLLESGPARPVLGRKVGRFLF
jgi:hypothetical protein